MSTHKEMIDAVSTPEIVKKLTVSERATLLCDIDALTGIFHYTMKADDSHIRSAACDIIKDDKARELFGDTKITPDDSMILSSDSVKNHLEQWAELVSKQDMPCDTWTEIPAVPGYKFKNLRVHEIAVPENQNGDTNETILNITHDGVLPIESVPTGITIGDFDVVLKMPVGLSSGITPKPEDVSQFELIKAYPGMTKIKTKTNPYWGIINDVGDVLYPGFQWFLKWSEYWKPITNTKNIESQKTLPDVSTIESFELIKAYPGASEIGARTWPMWEIKDNNKPSSKLPHLLEWPEYWKPIFKNTENGSI